MHMQFANAYPSIQYTLKMGQNFAIPGGIVPKI